MEGNSLSGPVLIMWIPPGVLNTQFSLTSLFPCNTLMQGKTIESWNANLYIGLPLPILCPTDQCTETCEVGESIHYCLKEDREGLRRETFHRATQIKCSPTDVHTYVGMFPRTALRFPFQVQPCKFQHQWASAGLCNFSLTGTKSNEWQKHLLLCAVPFSWRPLVIAQARFILSYWLQAGWVRLHSALLQNGVT